MADPTVSWADIDGRRCLVVAFDGRFTGDQARHTLTALREALVSADGPVTMIWQADAMTGYSAEGRLQWQDGMHELKSQVREVHLVSRSAVIRMGGAVVGMFLKLQITSWPALDAIRFARAEQ